ncbi:hypothetical protein DFJ63DRAFT_335511 [Scheffersomyces coipomensis]|uniref:uncharacterized protein n=1 Tax=Scheffersomyces coipomensis TaxID=1788519 RepID=UPI00315C5CE1
MDESFHFALLRISIAQILKSNGFDKCKPSTLNIVTDIYIQYMNKLIDQVNQCISHNGDIDVIDVFQALSLIGTVKPSTFIKLPPKGVNLGDGIEINVDKQMKVTNTKSIEAFKNWIDYSDEFRLSYKLNQLPMNLIKNLIEKRKIDGNDGETDQERRKRKRKERQEYYNQLNLIEQNPNSNNTPGLTRTASMQFDQHLPPQQQQQQQIQPDDEDKLTNKDKLLWINYLIEKDLKLGHDLKFINTSLEQEFLKFQSNIKFHPDQQKIHNVNKHDHIIINIDEVDDENVEQPPQIQTNVTNEVVPIHHNEVKPSEELNELLPYNIKYNDKLLDDDLNQYIPQPPKEEVPIETNEGDRDDRVFEDQGLIHQDDNIIINDEGVGGDNSLIF